MNICKKKVALVLIIRSLFCDHNNYIYFMYSERIVRNYEKRYTYLVRCKQAFQKKKTALLLSLPLIGILIQVDKSGCLPFGAIYRVCNFTFYCETRARVQCMHVHIRGQKQTHNYVNINILTLKEAIQMNINKFLASGRKSISSLRQKHGPVEQ